MSDGPTRSPVILFGALRSGTTLLRLMLDGHQSINCPGETDYLFDFMTPLQSGSFCLDEARLADDRRFRTQIGATPRGSPPEVFFGLMRALEQKDPTAQLVLVLHRGLEKALTRFPDARVIHLVRDPRDVARSSIGMGWAGNVYHGVDHWCATEAQWDRALELLHPPQLWELKYEDLIDQPEHMLKALCRFLELDWDPGMLRYPEQSSYAAPDRRAVEQWRSKLSPRQIGLVEGKVGPLLARRGYRASGYDIIAPSAVARLCLRFDNWLGVWRARFRRFGLRDPIVEMVTRRIGRPRWSAGARGRMELVREAELQ